MGRGYVIEHCISTLRQSNRDELYRVFVTEALRTIARGVGYDIPESYYQMAEDMFSKVDVEETRTSTEIIDSIKAKVKNIKGGEVG